ncbi:MULTISPECIES: DUF2917 domain-containing protein [unclassified Herbaspirillum]|uniref:DUF2917 domain-containing protein n=1 Tax=unclassified Herbaspirillum TaxID=2624150 RepID=UPI00115448D8|nr:MULTISPECIES: DUF2917 domain-containing protein [unclassified Herbaspirillum]MBB5393960.1 hypothetical protein [Herbaspirillum sp. SJZ102]TQK00004.1 DUF2917 family protein [Herbaspirillum sp. SJZ130]TQK04672.1 DUF2917 family protein [Herbaspirillum sp. SJZ106]TWC63211.1 DUF2917 family protein [Herbaspirillum sp. SJZ099]
MPISFTNQTAPLCLEEGRVHAVRLQHPVRVRVRCGLVWLTVEEGGADVWLSPGRDFDFHGRGLAVFEAVKGRAEFDILPLPGPLARAARVLRGWLARKPQATGPAAADCCAAGEQGALRISRLLPRGLIRWF